MSHLNLGPLNELSFTSKHTVMVQTWHPGNIGAAARAMKTMGLNDLVLVNPVDYPHKEADSLAAGALDVLQQARVVSSVEEAIEDCQLVLATSARTRSHPWPIKEAREAAPQIVSEARQGKVAIMFGPERMGLHNDHLRQAHFHVDIPGNPEYGVLNVASAVQLISYECFLAQRETYASADETYPQIGELNKFYQHLENTLDKISFLNKAHPGQAMLRLKRLFNRARPEKTELNMLRGILSSMDKLNSQLDIQNKQGSDEKPNETTND